MDIHAFRTDGTKGLTLAGLRFEDEPATHGGADGDVAAHAAADSLLSAAGLGDLGSQFPASDPQWQGASGATLLSEAAVRVRAAGFDIGNIAVQVIASRPRIEPVRDEAGRRLSQLVGAQVTVSATASDGLAFTGRGEGVAAIATALVAARDDFIVPL